MELPREVIKWLQFLNLPYSFKNLKDVSNGVLIAEMLNLYIPQSISMNSIENGFSKEIKKKNWKIIKRVLDNCNILFDEKPVINGDKNEIADLIIKLYEFFNQRELTKESYFIKDDNTDDSKTSCYARPTIAQKIRESDVHDIVDEKQKMIHTFELVKKEEKHQQMLKKKKKELEKNEFSKGLQNFNEIEHICSITDIRDASNYTSHTEIHTLDSFIKGANDRDYNTTLNSTLKESLGKVRYDTTRHICEDEDLYVAVTSILSEYIPDKDLQNYTEKVDAIASEKKKGVFPIYNFYAASDEVAISMCTKFHMICFLKKKEVVDKILEQLKQRNEQFQRILSSKAYQFSHLWKMFFPIITSPDYDEDMCVSITNYLKQFLQYLQINDASTMEILCNVVLRSLFLIDETERRELKYFCELLLLLIKDDKHICINILHMIKNIMSFRFFYAFLSTLLDKSSPSFLKKKDIKDIYFYYIFVGLHNNKSEILWYTIDMLHALSTSEEYTDIIFLSSLLRNITQLNNSHYDVFLFIISANIIAKVEENEKTELYKESVDDFVHICSHILANTPEGEFLYLYFLHSHKIIHRHDKLLEEILTLYAKLNVEKQKCFFSDDLFGALFQNICTYKLIETKFSKVFNRSIINELTKINNETILQSLLNKNEWHKKNYVNFLRNAILYDGSINTFKFYKIYRETFKEFVLNLFKTEFYVFESSKNMLECFWHWPHKTEEINKETFGISLDFLKKTYSTNRNKLPNYTAEYFEQLQRTNLIQLSE